MLVDFRENRSKVPALLGKFGIPIQTSNLVTDYIISKDCFVERKTVTDFISSIADKRIFRQVEYLSCKCPYPLVIIEGKDLFNNQLAINTIRGVMLWISFKKNVPVLQTSDEYDTASVLRLLWRKYDRSISNRSITHPLSHLSLEKPRRKKISFWQQQIAILTQIPDVGPQTATNILASFGSVASLVQTPDAQLGSIPHVGKKKLTSLRQLFPYVPKDA